MTLEQTTDVAPTCPSVTDKRSDILRISVAVLFIPLLYVLIRYLPPHAFFPLVVGTALLATYEFYRLHFGQERIPLELALGLGATGLVLAGMQWPGVVPDQLLWLLILSLVLITRLFSGRDTKRVMTDSAILLFGVVYIGLTLGHLLLIRAREDGVFLIFFLLLVTWGGDTGAYTAGKTLGRTKLAPVISPNKTVEGFFGGLALGTALALVARSWFLPAFTVGDCVVLGLLLSGIGALGDLAESALKRSAGVKDSGRVIPGHGGILDRVDSLLFTAPLFYYYVTLIKH